MSYPLVLGNEATGDRPWRGRIFEIYLFDKALPEKMLGSAIKPENDLLVSLSWKIMTYGPLESARIKAKEGPGLFHEEISTAPSLWLESAKPPASLTQRLKKSSQFTLVTTIATEDVHQNGPARIISLSKDANNRNFTLAQEGSDLVLRLRTPVTGENGIRPELRVAGVFATTEAKQIRIVYDGASLVAYVNGVRSSQPYELTLGFVALRYLPVRAPFDNMEFGRIIYYLVMFVPMGLLIQLASNSVKPADARTHQRSLALIMFFCVAMELILVGMAGKALAYENIVLAFVSSAIGASIVELSRTTHRLLSTGPEEATHPT
jgi:hypothetical protein